MYYVSKQINLLPGFSVLNGAKYKGIITSNCPEEYLYRQSFEGRERASISDIEKINNNEIAFSIGPNPSSDGVFEVNSKIDYSLIEDVKVYNVLGEMVVRNIYLNSTFNINLSHLSKGIYILRIKLKNVPTVFVHKLIYN